ncbi:L-ascorbate oxidase homolog [Malania oleifera]|uniref:L-ascorbate oxidase homolog n=1 Tax=Malania oleifera TaxID=397392 RepID=UPI0025ADA4F3|nr:L-ascorbate oxidase homolog [Malania oleifera]
MEEFMNLTQELLTVWQYAAKFLELSRFTQFVIPDEVKKAYKFHRGLRKEIRNSGASLQLYRGNTLTQGGGQQGGTAQARVYSLTPSDAENAGDVVTDYELMVATPSGSVVECSKVVRDFPVEIRGKERIRVAQKEDPELVEVMEGVQKGLKPNFSISGDGILRFHGKVRVSNDAMIKPVILEEAHRSLYTVHGILINGQFPGPQIECVTNDNLIITVVNCLDEPFLLSWNGIQNRRNSWQDGVYGTNCPIPPGQNLTYVLQVKDQIGTYFYFPSLALHKLAGGIGSIKIASRPQIPIPYGTLAGDFTILAGDWFTKYHKDLKKNLDNGQMLPFPDGLLMINGIASNGSIFTVDPGKTYRFRISNVGSASSINFRIQGHSMLLVEVEGTHTLQNTYSSLDVHVGQSYSVLVTANQIAQDYFIVASSRFTPKVLTATCILRYSNSARHVSGLPPVGPTYQIDYSLKQAKSIRTNLTASGPRPNPQGSYHYGMINASRTIFLANTAPIFNGKQRYAVNSVSFIPADTPLKLADWFNISGVFKLGSILDNPPITGYPTIQTSVMDANFRAFVEIVFQNNEDTLQSWHIDGYAFFVVGMENGQWTNQSRQTYNLRDAVSRCTTQVYPKSWTAIYMALDNVGMWNIRSENWARQYLGEQFYLRVYSPKLSWRDEYPIPTGARLCGRALGHKTRPL